MDLEEFKVSSVLELHKEFQKNKIILFYEGAFTQDLIKSVLKFAESKMEHMSAQTIVKKRVFNVMIECLQNICKHSDKDNSVIFDDRSMFLIANNNNQYIITTGNPVKKEKVTGITESLKKINELDQAMMKELFKSLLKDGGKDLDKGINGLGLLDIARKTGSKFNFIFKELDNNFSFFILQVKINYN